MTSLALAREPAPPARDDRDPGPEADFRFFVGVHYPALAWPLTLRGFRVCLSAKTLVGRAGDAPFLGCSDPWLLDSGAFTQVTRRGGFDQSPSDYAALVRRYARTGLLAAATQDFMCEPGALKATGLTVRAHQALTLDRYDAILDADTGGVPLMAVLQGWSPDDYRRHLEAYGARLAPGAWVGVGSVCKRQGDPRIVAAILEAVRSERPDLRLHGFGVKTTSLRDPAVRSQLATADSLAWSMAARREGRDQNAWIEAARFALGVGGCPEAVDRLARQAGWVRALDPPVYGYRATARSDILIPSAA
ncbi:hypothetical protein ACETK8_20080 (plasmid) [Brevundimonas staleyi]|uniref:DeoxyPurine in DNA protein A domain-containing protein n=1 Tax=Brevundimonas staleyi TaxID=74326 RepID=A0ABW0FRM9_9CAUL